MPLLHLVSKNMEGFKFKVYDPAIKCFGIKIELVSWPTDNILRASDTYDYVYPWSWKWFLNWRINCVKKKLIKKYYKFVGEK